MKALLRIGFLAAAIFFSGTLMAQENTQANSDLLNIYDTELFSWSYTTFGGLSLNLYNQSSSTVFGIGKTMQNALELFPDSSQEYDSYRRKNITGNVLTWGGLAVMLAGAFVPIMGDDDTFDTRMIIFSSAMGVGVISVIVGSFISSSALENLFYAVSNYNRNKMRAATSGN